MIAKSRGHALIPLSFIPFIEWSTSQMFLFSITPNVLYKERQDTTQGKLNIYYGILPGNKFE